MKLERVFTLLMLIISALTTAQNKSNPNYYVNDEPVDFSHTCIHPKQIDSLSVNSRADNGDVFIYTKDYVQAFSSSDEMLDENQEVGERIAYYINDNFNNTSGVKIDGKASVGINLVKVKSSIIPLVEDTEPIIKIDIGEGQSKPIVNIKSDRVEEKPRYFK